MAPLLETLTHHLAECPADFLAEPQIAQKGAVNVAAVVNDMLYPFSHEPLTALQARAWQTVNTNERNRLRLTLVACWLLHGAWLSEITVSPKLVVAIERFLRIEIAQLAEYALADKFVTDPDRREELARLCLKALGQRPAGETEAQAQDRLTTLSTAERQRVIKAAQEAEDRARQIREEMARQAAYDAQMKGMRE